MRRAAVVAPFVFAILACAKSETPADDTASMAVVAAALTEADVAGTWTGVSMPETSDSVLARWTMVCAGGSCTGTAEGVPDSSSHTYTMSGDSLSGSSQPYVDPLAGSARVTDVWAGRVVGGKMTGTGALRLAAKPDSVLMRYRFDGSRKM